MKFQMSEQTKIEAQMGFLIGILIGVMASWTFILFFVEWQWYFKLFSSIGEAGLIGSLGFQLITLYQMRKQYLEVQAEMKKASMPDSNIYNPDSTNQNKMKGGQ